MTTTTETEDFESPIETTKRTRRTAKSDLIGSLLSKDVRLNGQFDELKTQIKAPKSTRVPKMRNRRHGRPSGGKVRFEQVRIDALPEYGRVSEFARCLGIRDASLLQWVDLVSNPLPYVDDQKTGHKIFRKDIVVQWLESTGRYRRKPEYSDHE